MGITEVRPLSEYIKAGPLAPTEALTIAIKVAEGIGLQHQHGVVRLGIQPDNILLDSGLGGAVKLRNFRSARSIESAEFTLDGLPLGTVNYMSPEQALGRRPSNAMDIWSLGVVLYEMVAGRRPFQGDSDSAIIDSILNESPKALTTIRPDAPKELERVVNKCLAKKPNQRYADAHKLLMDLQSVREKLPQRR